MEIFFWLKFVCFDSPVGVASSAAPEEKSSTTNDNFFFQELNLVLHLPAKSFKEIVKTNVIQNWKRKNFCNKHFYLDFHVSYHNVQYAHCISDVYTFRPYLPKHNIITKSLCLMDFKKRFWKRTLGNSWLSKSQQDFFPDFSPLQVSKIQK